MYVIPERNHPYEMQLSIPIGCGFSFPNPFATLYDSNVQAAGKIENQTANSP